MKIEEELQQKRFVNEYHKTHLNILLTASRLNKNTSDLLRPFQITWQQFNVLRILRGIHPQAAGVKLLTGRMIDKMSNASRLVEKLRKKGYVERIMDKEDRRKVQVSITPKGLDLLEAASLVIDNQMNQKNIPLSTKEIVLLNNLLDKMR